MSSEGFKGISMGVKGFQKVSVGLRALQEFLRVVSDTALEPPKSF